MSESVLPMFSSRSFIVSGLTFRSFIHFEFIFVYGARKCSSFILLKVVDQFFQHHLLKRLSFLLCIFLPIVASHIYPTLTVTLLIVYNTLFKIRLILRKAGLFTLVTFLVVVTVRGKKCLLVLLFVV